MDELEILIQAILEIDKQKSLTKINKDIEKLEKKIQKLKITATLDKGKSKTEIQKQIEALNKQRKKLYVDLQLRKDTLKKQYKEIQKESNLSLNVDTTTAKKEISQTTNAIQATRNETNTLANSLQKAFANIGLVVSAQSVLQAIRKAASEAAEAVKLYDSYVTNLSVITGNSREKSSQYLGNLAEKSLDFKVDVSALEGAAETLLRTGKSIDETNKYLENTIYLSKLGFQDMDTSASQLVTIGNAYGYTTNEMSAVVDKFVKLDTQANITAGKLAEGVAKSAQNAKLAGFNIDQLAASIAGLKDTTGRSESEISNSLSMIFSRLQNVKLGKFVLETEDGTEDITEQINDMEKLLDTFGIKLRNSKNEFRDINELFTELSDNWSKFNSVQQSAIATTAAGARQRNTFIALIENWNKIQELTDVSINSMGTAAQKYENYLQSIEAKSATFSTATKELWNNLLPTNFVGNVTDAGTAVVQFTDKYQILQTALKSAAFYALAKGLITTKNSLVGMAKDIKNVSYAMDLATKSGAMTSQRMADLQNITKVLTDSQLKLVLSNSNLSKSEMIKLLSIDDVTTAEAEQRLATLGIVEANTTATTSTFSLSGAFKTLWNVLSANPIMALTMAFTGVVTVYQTVQRKNEELQESAVEAIKQYDEQAQSLEDLRQKYIDIVDSEDSTAKKTEELNEWKKTLIETYGLEKQAIEQVNLARENGLKLIDDEIIKNKINGAETWLTENKNAYEDAKKKLLGTNNSTETAVISKANIVMNVDKSALDDYSENFDDIMKQLTIKNPTKDNPLAQIKIQGSNVLQQYENLSKILNEITSIEVTKGLNKSEQELYDALLAKQKEYKKVVTDDMKDIVENGKKYTSMIQLYNFETDSGINFQNVSADTYKEFRDKFLESLGYAYKKDSEDFSLDIEKILLAMLPDLENSYRGIEITDIIDTSNSDRIVDDISTVENAVEDLEKSLEKLSKSANSYVSNQKTISNAFAEIEKYGQLSASTIQSLTEAGYAQALSVDSTTNAVTLNKSAVEKLNEQYREKIKLDGIQQKSELEEKFKEEQKAITDLSTEMRYANQERREAIMLEMQQHGLAMSDIAEQMAQIDALANSVYAPTFESGSNTDAWKEKAENEIADIEHLYAMEKITYEDYINQLDDINQKYFANNSKYLTEFYKYEETVYKGRKKLAEDFYNEQKKAFENRIDNLEAQITVTTNDSVDKDGNKLKASEKFNYLRDVYDEILAEIETRENEIVQSGIEGHEDELTELAKKYEEYANKKADIFKDEIQYEIDYISELEKKYNDFIDKRIDRYEDEKDALEDRYDTEIKAIDKTIKALKDKNEEDKTALDLAKAKQELENAKQRTRKVYDAGGRIIYKQDTDKISEAQQKVNDLEQEQIINGFEKLKDTLEDQKKIEVDKYDSMIDALNEQKDKQSDYYNSLLEILNAYLNPKATENLDTVFERVLGDKDKVKTDDGVTVVNGTAVDTHEVDKGRLTSDRVNEQLKKTNKLSLEEILKDIGVSESIAKSLTHEKLSQIFGLSSIKPITPIISQPNTASLIRNESIMRNNNDNKSQPINVTFEGGINIQNPVGEVQQFAKELLLQLPTAFNRQIYSNLK